MQVFVAARAFPLAAVSGGYSLVAACGLTAVASLALAGRFFYHCNMWEEVISKYKLPEFFKYKDPGPKREVRDKNSIMSQLVWTYFNIKNLDHIV